MDILSDYIISRNTVLLTGEYDQYGFLCTRVIDGEETFLVHLSPVDLIDRNLLRVGSNFHGAMRSSKFNLGSKNLCPLKINEGLDIWVFPTKSYKKPNCVWFFLHHITSTKALGVRKTEVSLSFFHTFTIDMKQSSFNHKRQKAADLRDMVLKNGNVTSRQTAKPKVGFQISEDAGKNRYRIQKPDEQ